VRRPMGWSRQTVTAAGDTAARLKTRACFDGSSAACSSSSRVRGGRNTCTCPRRGSFSRCGRPRSPRTAARAALTPTPRPRRSRPRGPARLASSSGTPSRRNATSPNTSTTTTSTASTTAASPAAASPPTSSTVPESEDEMSRHCRHISVTVRPRGLQHAPRGGSAGVPRPSPPASRRRY
jgi:hypothetical protein